MIPKPAKSISTYMWVRGTILIICGLFVLFATYMMYKDYVLEDKIVDNSPLVCMKVTERVRGAGTVKFPYTIYATFESREYKFECGSKYFRKTIGIDSIQVHYDPTIDRAVLPMHNLPHYTFLLIMFGGVGLLMIYAAFTKDSRGSKPALLPGTSQSPPDQDRLKK